MPTARRTGRICVWPTYDDAADADTPESKHDARLVVWPTTTQAQANMELDEDGGGAYVAEAVHFDGTAYLSNEAFVSVDGPYWAFSAWVKIAWLAGGATGLLHVQFEGGDGTMIYSGGAGNFSVGVAHTEGASVVSSDITMDAEWHHILVAAKTNETAGNKILQVLVDGEVVSGVDLDASGSFIAAMNGVGVYVIGGVPFGGAAAVGDIADLRIMPNTNLLSGGVIPPAMIALFIDADGKPVDPAVATAALGVPAVLFSGDASAFPINAGTGGPFVLTGTLTNASTSPSD